MAMLTCINQVTKKLRNFCLQEKQIRVDKAIDSIIVHCTVVVDQQISKIID